MADGQLTPEEKAAKAKSFFRAAAFVLVLFLLYKGYTNFYLPSQIQKDASITTGKLTKLLNYGMRGMKEEAIFKFAVDGKIYESTLHTAISCNHDQAAAKQELYKFNFPIVYNANDPRTAELLITPERFKKYDLVFPDSLRAMYNKYWDCN